MYGGLPMAFNALLQRACGAQRRNSATANFNSTASVGKTSTWVSSAPTVQGTIAYTDTSSFRELLLLIDNYYT